MSDRLAFFRSTEPPADPLVTLAADLASMLADCKPPAVRVAESRVTAARGKRAAIHAEQRALATTAAENGTTASKSEVARLADALAEADAAVADAHGRMRAARETFARDLVDKVEPYRQQAARRLAEALETAALAMNVLSIADRFVVNQGLAQFGTTPFRGPTPHLDIVGGIAAAQKIANT